MALIESFKSDEPRYRIQRIANQVAEKLQKEKKLVPDEIVKIRETVDELKKESEKAKKDIEDLKNKLSAKGEDKEPLTGGKTADQNSLPKAVRPADSNQPADPNRPQNTNKR